VRRIFKLSIASILSVLVAWLGFVAWSIHSMLPDGADDTARDLVEHALVQSSPTQAAARDAAPAELQARNVAPAAQFEPGAELQPRPDNDGCGDPNAPLRWHVADPAMQPADPAFEITSAEMLEQRAMSGDARAQLLIGFNLQQQLVMRVPTKDRASISPQRFEYMRNFLILAVKSGSRSAAFALADAYAATQRDVVETAAWLRIAGRLEDWERQGIIVLSDEPRAESLRVAAELAELYNLPISRGAARVVPDHNTSDPTSADCIPSRLDPYSSAAADLEAYRADVQRNSLAPSVDLEADLRRRFRDMQKRSVASLRLGNRSALPTLVTLHQESLASENEVAAAVWSRVGSTLYAIDAAAGSPNASGADTTPALPPSAELPILSAEQIADPEFREIVDNLRRRGVREGILAEQYIMLFDLD